MSNKEHSKPIMIVANPDELKPLLTRSYIEQMVKPIEWNGWRGKLEAFSFSIIENEMSAFEVCFGKDCLNGHYIDTSSTIDGAKELAQAFLVDLICSALGIED
jgi:hypothetical protein